MSNSHLNRPADLAKVGDSTRGLAWAGFVLICGAFAMPVIGEWLGARTEVVLVQWVGEQLGALLGKRPAIPS